MSVTLLPEPKGQSLEELTGENRVPTTATVLGVAESREVRSGAQETRTNGERSAQGSPDLTAELFPRPDPGPPELLLPLPLLRHQASGSKGRGNRNRRVRLPRWTLDLLPQPILGRDGIVMLTKHSLDLLGGPGRPATRCTNDRLRQLCGVAQAFGGDPDAMQLAVRGMPARFAHPTLHVPEVGVKELPQLTPPRATDNANGECRRYSGRGMEAIQEVEVALARQCRDEPLHGVCPILGQGRLQLLGRCCEVASKDVGVADSSQGRTRST